jgi:hypothetical protein
MADGANLEMRRRVKAVACAILLTSAPLLWPGQIPAESIPVRHAEGLVHGFLVLSTLEGKVLADGDLIQVAHGDQVTSELILHFTDGSIHDETAVFSQRRTFRLVSAHLVQKGPAFERPMDELVVTSTGDVTTRYTDKDGKEKVATDRLTMPSDVANGIVLILLKNLRPNAAGTTVSMVAATPKPRLVKLAISSLGEDMFSVGASPRRATHYVIKVDIGGVAGLLAPLLGKQPPDIHVWILEGKAPGFVKFEGPLYLGGPIWRIELTNPTWPSGR